jgi:hypothetical protein
VVGILVLKNTGSGSKPINATSPTTTLPALGAPVPTVTTPTTSPTTSPTTTPPTTAPLNPANVKVLVLNGTTTSGAATYFTNKLHGAGYNTLAAGNATARSVSTTMVYANKAGSPATTGVAHTLGVGPSSIASSIPPNAPVAATLLQQDNPNVLVVIGTDISSQATSGSSSPTTTTPSTTTPTTTTPAHATTPTTRPASPSTT